MLKLSAPPYRSPRAKSVGLVWSKGGLFWLHGGGLFWPRVPFSRGGWDVARTGTVITSDPRHGMDGMDAADCD